MRFNRRHEFKEATFDLTAMIDVVLLLIIFFMLSSQFAKVQLSPMALPQEPGEAVIGLAHEATLILELDAAGGLSLMDAGPISREELTARLDRERERSGGSLARLEVLIRADRTGDARHLNRLAGLLARAGVRHWKLATEGSGGGGGGGA